MTDPTTTESQLQPARAEFQFGLDAFLWMFVVVAVFLAYIRTFNPDDIGKFVLVATVDVLVGGAIGLLAGGFSSAVFWAGIGAVGGYLAVVAYLPFPLDPGIRLSADGRNRRRHRGSLRRRESAAANDRPLASLASRWW